MKFIDLLQEHKVPFQPEGHHHCRPGWVQVDCPWCCGKGANKWHLGYNLAFGYMNCWRCGRHNVHETVAELTGLPLGEVRRLLHDVEREAGPEPVARGKLAIPRAVGPLKPQHCRYLRKRGFEPNALRRLWDIGGIGCTGGSLAWRLFIPIHLRGQIVSWTTRSIDERVKKKYRAAQAHEEAVSRQELLYGEDYCRGTALVFEGPPDVWRVGPGAVCTFGVIWSLQQLHKLTKYPRVVCCFDMEEAAQKRARQLCETVALFTEAVNVLLPRKGRDLDRDTVRKLRKKWL